MSNDTSPTPGPWGIIGEDDARNKGIVGKPDGGRVLCYVSGFGELHDWKPNARLIAQAPAMFDLLWRVKHDGGWRDDTLAAFEDINQATGVAE